MSELIVDHGVETTIGRGLAKQWRMRAVPRNDGGRRRSLDLFTFFQCSTHVSNLKSRICRRRRRSKPLDMKSPD